MGGLRCPFRDQMRLGDPEVFGQPTFTVSLHSSITGYRHRKRPRETCYTFEVFKVVPTAKNLDSVGSNMFNVSQFNVSRPMLAHHSSLWLTMSERTCTHQNVPICPCQALSLDPKAQRPDAIQAANVLSVEMGTMGTPVVHSAKKVEENPPAPCPWIWNCLVSMVSGVWQAWHHDWTVRVDIQQTRA